MKFLTDFTYRNLHGFARFPSDSTALVYLTSIFSVFALLLDDALKPATPLTIGAINENKLIFDEVKAYKNDIFLDHPDVIPAGCDSYFRRMDGIGVALGIYAQ